MSRLLKSLERYKEIRSLLWNSFSQARPSGKSLGYETCFWVSRLRQRFGVLPNDLSRQHSIRPSKEQVDWNLWQQPLQGAI